MMEDNVASTSPPEDASSAVLGYCSSVPLYSNFLSGRSTVTEVEVATQILAPLMAQIASRHPSKDLQSRQKAQGSFPGITGETKGKGLAQPIPLDSEGLGEKEEVWKAGAVAYELLVGHPPTAVPAAPPTSTGLVRQTSFLGFLGFLSDDCVNFLQAALREDARERPSAAECLDHPWMRLPTAKQQASGKTAPAFSSSSAEADPLWIWTPGVGTFASPSHSLSPMMATWKIPTQAEGSRPGSGSSASDAGLEPPSPLHRTSASPGSEDEAEDVFPRIPSVPEGGFLAGRRSTSLSRATLAAIGSQDFSQAQPATDSFLKRTYSVGKSRFA